MPYANLMEFMQFIEKGHDSHQHLQQAIILAISKSESLYDEVRGKENLCIRTRHDADERVRAFFTYPASEFVLEQESSPSQARYVEYLPGVSTCIAHTTLCLRLLSIR